MNVVNPNNTEHILTLIPRYYPIGSIVLELYNEATQESQNFNIALYPITNGYIDIIFDYNFSEGDRYQFKVLENDNIIYRGLLIATSQETQSYLTDENQYHYE